MSDTVEIPIPDFAADGAVAKKSKRPAKAAAVPVKAAAVAVKAAPVPVRAAAPDLAVLEGLSLNSALAEIESATLTKLTPRKPHEKAKRPPPKYVRKRP